MASWNCKATTLCQDKLGQLKLSKIVVLTDSLGGHSGGLAHATLNLAFSTAAISPDDELFVMSQSDHSELDIGMTLPSNLSIIKYSGFRNSFFPYSPYALKSLLSLNADLLHLRGLWRQSSILASYWKKITNNPLIVQTAGMLEPWARRRNSLIKKIYYKFVESQVFHLADFIHATSRSEKETLLDLGFPEKKIFILEEGVHIPFDNPPTFPLRNGRTKVLLFLARLHPVKGIELLLESLSLLRPRDWHCKIAGMGEPGYVAHLHKLVHQYGLTETVSFSGALSGIKKDQAFTEASAFILPSYSESFGISIAEAMAWGLPVITTSETPWSALEELHMGWIVEPAISPITEALFQLMQTSDNELHEMGKRANQYVKERYDWRYLANRMSEIYRALLI